MTDLSCLPKDEGILYLIEKLDEILKDTYSIPSAIQAAVHFLLSESHRNSGGLVVAATSQEKATVQVWVDPLPEWTGEDGSYSDGIREGMDEAAGSSCMKKMPNYCIWPVQTNGRIVAFLILEGDITGDEEQFFLKLFSLLVARKIDYLQTHAASIDRGHLLDLVKLTAYPQRSDIENNEIQLNFVREIARIFDAGMVGLYLPINENLNQAERKIYLNKFGWHEIIQMPFDKGLAKQSFKEGKLRQWENVQQNEHFSPEVDAVPSIIVNTLICLPLMIGRKCLGILSIANSPLIPLSRSDSSLVSTVVFSLAASIESDKKMHSLALENSSLELKLNDITNSRNTLRVLFDNIPASIYIIDGQHRIVAVNKARAMRAGTTPKKIYGQYCYEALFGLSDFCPGCLALDSLRSGEITDRYSQFTDKEDQITEWEIKTYPIFDEHNQAVQVILHEQDITLNRRLEATLIQSEKLAAIGQLAAGVAHEINNPLAAVIANAQILKQDVPPENVDLMESVKLIELAGLRASHVVKNLLGLARKDSYEFRALDINENIQDALSLLSHEFVARPISIRFERSKGIPFIYASAEHLESVWINLITNAIESIGDAKGEININTFYDEGNFYVLIKDSGSGISPEHLGHIFEPFYTTKGHGRGTGLGLSVVQRIVKAHDGKIQVDSEVGKGTTFTVILPEKKVPDEEFSE